MGNLKVTDHTGSNIQHESLRINKNARRINCVVFTYKYRDKDTRQMVVYIPSLELSGYGATDDKADKMLRESIDDYFKILIAMPQDALDIELRKLGWSHSKYKNKEYSKCYIDGDGNLKNFNAVGDKVEQAVLSY